VNHVFATPVVIVVTVWTVPGSGARMFGSKLASLRNVPTLHGRMEELQKKMRRRARDLWADQQLV